jgi:hypothetical protein
VKGWGGGCSSNIHFGEVFILFIFVHPKLSLVFPLRIGLRPVIVNNHFCHVLPFMSGEIDIVSHGLFFNGRPVVIDLSA